MASYLLHQLRDGTPVGVWTEVDYYYDPRYEDRFAQYGQSVIAARGDSVTWEDYAEQLASKTPTPTAMWDLFEHDEAALKDILRAAQNSLES